MANEQTKDTKRKEKKNWFAQVNYEITQVLIEFYTRAEFTNGNQAEQSRAKIAESGEWRARERRVERSFVN